MRFSLLKTLDIFPKMVAKSAGVCDDLLSRVLLELHKAKVALSSTSVLNVGDAMMSKPGEYTEFW